MRGNPNTRRQLRDLKEGAPYPPNHRDTSPISCLFTRKSGLGYSRGANRRLLTSRRVDNWVSTYHSWEQPRCPHDFLQLKGSGIHAQARPVTPRRLNTMPTSKREKHVLSMILGKPTLICQGLMKMRNPLFAG
jgi:hypothetical protein